MEVSSFTQHLLDVFKQRENRATMVNGAVKSGDNVLVTGVGGGVAIVALQLAVAAGANVYVTSGSEDKIRKAVELGAKGGVSYKNSASCTGVPA